MLRQRCATLRYALRAQCTSPLPPRCQLIERPITSHAAPAARAFASSALCSSAVRAVVPEWASAEARSAAEGLLARFPDARTGERPAVQHAQQLDANQLHLLRITLDGILPLQEGLADAALRDERSPLLPAEHLVYFTPRVASSTLGADGTDTSFNPPGGVFTRRMWAGGRIKFAEPLRLGQHVVESTFIESVEVKKLGKGGEMLLVWVRKELRDASGSEPLVTDYRSWIFQVQLDPRNPPTPPAPVDKGTEIQVLHDPASSLAHLGPARAGTRPAVLHPNAGDLFRYSALTFNGHAIHLDREWAREREGHADLVIHGPLNLTLLLRKWLLDHHGQNADAHSLASAISSVEYRAKKPVYCGQTYFLQTMEEKGKNGEDVVGALRPDGTVIMEANIVPHA